MPSTRSWMCGVKIPSVGIPIVWISCSVATVIRLKSVSHACVREQVAVHVPRRRHVLDRAVGEQLARQLRLRPLVQQPVLDRRVDLERVAERDLLVGHAASRARGWWLMNCEATTEGAASSASAVRR